VIAASAVLFLLVVSRMAGLVRQEEKRASRELALRRAGLALVAGAGSDSVRDAAVHAARSLLGDEASVRLALLTPDGAELAASSDHEVCRAPLSPDVNGWLRGTGGDPLTLRLDEAPASIREELLLDGDGVACCLPLAVRGEALGVLVAVAANRPPRELLNSLEALAAQASLAVEGAALAEDLHRRRSEARFGSLVAHASDLITVLDEDGTVTYQSPSVARILGYAVEEIEGQPFARLLRRSDWPRLANLLTRGAGIRNSSPDTHVIECTLRHRDGTWLQFEMQHTNLVHDEHVRGIVLNGRDVSERKAFEDQLAHQAFHDPVTDLANRALFADRVQHAVRRSLRDATVVGVMFIDLDDFKTVNDSLGHAAGDSVLKEVARRLEASVRPSDTVARMGGDEFAILLDAVDDSREVATVAGRVRQTLETPMVIDGRHVYPRASIGICMGDGEANTYGAEELLRNADLAMYMAKRDSKGSYRLFEPAMHDSVVERLELQAELQQALELEQLAVYYQPVVHLNGDHANYGVEALLRWNHPQRGIVAPLQFIPLAEETGLIVSIGAWVLRAACRQGAILHERFPRPYPLTISVNLSAKQLQSESIVADVEKALAESGLEPSALVLEITETVMMSDFEVAVARLKELKTLGVRIAMDDFGTGYSSLSYLSRLPVDILKMDRSFLAGDGETPLAAAIIAIGDRLGLEVVAEGIERDDQIDSLRNLGCPLGQGFRFARPMTPEMLLGYLLEERPARAGRAGGSARSDAA